MTVKDKINTIIIGAGIGGLTCGCYLAKEGLRVMVIEQRDRPGGYCSSFSKDGYVFDVGVHYLGGIKSGALGKILQELDVLDALGLVRFDPTDKIVTPDSQAYIYSDMKLTIEGLSKCFPKERSNISRFVNYVTDNNIYNLFSTTINKTFNDVLDSFFDCPQIKGILEALLGNLGLSAERMSAWSACILYREYIFDGGYYPKGGMQSFADALAHRFIKDGGELVLEKKVDKILLKDRQVMGIVLNDGKKIFSDTVVSNADATDTFKVMLKECQSDERTTVDTLDVSPSLFAVYVGLDCTISNMTRETCTIWSFNDSDIGKCLSGDQGRDIAIKIPFAMITFPSSHNGVFPRPAKDTVQIFTYVPSGSHVDWNDTKERFMNAVVDRTETLLPGLNRHVKVKYSATPETFFKYTSNRDGAAFGWASTKDQISPTIMPQITSIDGLFLAGHWCTIGSGQGGVPKSVFSGKKAAELVLKRAGK